MSVIRVPLPESVITSKRLGRHVVHDPRSLSFAWPEGTTTPSTVFWQRKCDPYDQGDLGSCTGNAAAGLLMTEPFVRPTWHFTEADAVRLYARATHLDNVLGVYPPHDTGSSGLGVMKAAKEAGYITGYQHILTPKALLNALSTGPVICGVNWYDSFDQPDAQGVVRIPSGAKIRGGHEIECFGFDQATSLLWFWQSWGPDWGVKPPQAGRAGVKGAFALSLSTMTRLMAEKGDVTRPLLHP